MEAKFDQNHRNTLTAYNETTGLIEDCRVDPILGALYVFGVVSDSATPTTRLNTKNDGNTRNTLGAYNETTGQVESLQCSQNGELLVIAV